MVELINVIAAAVCNCFLYCPGCKYYGAQKPVEVRLS